MTGLASNWRESVRYSCRSGIWRHKPLVCDGTAAVLPNSTAGCNAHRRAVGAIATLPAARSFLRRPHWGPVAIKPLNYWTSRRRLAPIIGDIAKGFAPIVQKLLADRLAPLRAELMRLRGEMMPDDRAYSLQLETKAFDESRRTFGGTASTPKLDRVGDSLDPLGATFTLPVPLLMYHDHRLPVGSVHRLDVSETGIKFEASVAKPETAGTVADRCLEAWDSIKSGVIRAVSVGFLPIEFEPIRGAGLKFSKWEIVELSLVSAPAQSEATITTIRSFDVSSSAKPSMIGMLRAPRLRTAGTKRAAPVVSLGKGRPRDIDLPWCRATRGGRGRASLAPLWRTITSRNRPENRC